MRIAIIVLVCLCILPYIMACISGYYRRKQLGTIDNKKPREQYAQLEGPGARAVAAQQNAWEALIIYSAALLAVVAARVDVPNIALAAIIVLIARVAHGFFYLVNLDKLRTLSFLVAIVACFYLFFIALANLFMR
ncbi:MAG: hypothetical protein B0W54_00335 [Cellvibrio sp. 79]|nr:MAG: hypothetical protein B0W54_00335 [Cellvibrio sp. 79]